MSKIDLHLLRPTMIVNKVTWQWLADYFQTDVVTIFRAYKGTLTGHEELKQKLADWIVNPYVPVRY